MSVGGFSPGSMHAAGPTIGWFKQPAHISAQSVADLSTAVCFNHCATRAIPVKGRNLLDNQ